MREVGRGGMATVYLAHDLRHDRPVALKVLRPDLGPALGAERFLREIRVAARLQHPHILTVLDSGETAGLLWFAMPFVEGETLRARLLREGPLPVATALRITREVAQALQYAHARGVVHRDIKPENLLLTADGSTLVADFGIAHDRGATAGAERLTEVGLSMGTPAYMSPEQSSAERDLDARSDEYSLACVLHEMLAGQPPHAAPTAQAMLVRRFTQPPPPVRGARPDAPPAVEAALLRALARDPADRFASVAEFAAALDATVQATMPVPAMAAPARTASVAVLPFTVLGGDAETGLFADGIVEDVIAHLAKVRTLSVIAHASARQLATRDLDLREVGARLQVAALLQGSVRRAGDRVRIVAQLVDTATAQHLWAETYDRRLDDVFAIQTDVALHIAEALRAELSPEERSRIVRGPTRDLHAWQLYQQGRHWFIQYSDTGIRQAQRYFAEALAADPSYALAQVGLARCWAENVTGQGGTEPPEESIRRARDGVQRALALDPALGDAWALLGLVRFAFDYDWAGGEEALRRALELSPSAADALDYYGWLCGSLERFDEAVTYARRAQELDPLAHRSDVASALLRASRWEEARAAAERSVEFDPGFARGHSALGWALIRLGEAGRGLAELEAAVRLGPRETIFEAQYAQALAECGQPERARALLASLEALSRTRYVSPYHFAYVLTGLGEHDAAIQRLEQAMQERSGGIWGVKGSFLFRALHPHPRFQALLRTMNLA